MVRITDRIWNRLRSLCVLWRVAGVALFVSALFAVVLASAGCSNGAQASGKGASSEATASTSSHMAGPAIEVHIPQSAVDNAPVPWDLRTPESAVRSYLAWISYAYRIGQSVVATPTMTPFEEVRVDSYNQFNLEKSRLIDQRLDSITFGAKSTGATSTLVPAKEKWTYSYLSVAEGNKSLGGPYSVSYDSTYTVVKTARGWLVDSGVAAPEGTIK
jgi:hypothetical protein